MEFLSQHLHDNGNRSESAWSAKRQKLYELCQNERVAARARFDNYKYHQTKIARHEIQLPFYYTHLKPPNWNPKYKILLIQ